MADDVKLTLGIDVEALQRSASQATNVLTQAFSQGVGANLLGNGLVPNQVASATGQGSGNNIAGIIGAIQRVNQTLVVGFNALAGGVYLGGGGGGGGGAAGGSPGMGGAGAAGGGLAPAAPGQGVAGGRFGIGAQILSRAGDLAAALMPSSMKMFMGGFYGTDVMGFMHNLVSQIPIAGRLLGAVTGPFHQVMQQNDEFKNMQYETFRDVGEDAMNTFTNFWVDDDKRERFLKRYGMSRSETQQLVHAGFRAGVGGGPGTNKAVETILNMQGQLGLGTEAAGAMGALRRAGLVSGQGQEAEVMANAIGVAVQTGLERGRWGEMLTLWQRAAQSSVDTDIAWRQVAAQQQFVGSLGDRFRGDTPAAQSMDAALRGMASNAQSPLALRAAMQMTGGDYFGATARMARAAEQPDTELQEAVINQLMGTSIAQAWLAMPDGPDADRMLDRVAGVGAAFGTGLSQLKIVTLLKARKGAQGALFKGPAPQAVDIGRQQVTGGAPLPGTALGPRRSQTEAQRPSDISSIQGVGPVAPMSPGDQLRTSPIGMPTIDDLRAGRWTFDIPGAGGGSAPVSGTGSYQSFVGQRFGNPLPGRSAHPGVDLMFPPGTTVTCHVDGTITTIRDSRITGNKDETGIGIHVRDDRDGSEWKFYHLDPSTVPKDLVVGTHVSKGTVLGRTFDFAKWKDTGTRTHLHLGHVGASGSLLDPLASGAVPPGALTGGIMPSSGSAGGATSSAGASGGAPQVDLHLYIHQDQAGRPVVRARGPGVHVVSSPGQLVGGHR